MKHSKYQEDIFTWVKHGQGNAVVNAVAGSGKTYTLVQSLSEMRGKVQLLAFNKHIADDISKHIILPNVNVSTINSFGYSVLRKHMPAAKLDKWKTYTHLQTVVRDTKLVKQLSVSVSRAVGLLKANYDGTTFAKMSDVLDDIIFPSAVADPKGIVAEVFARCMTDQSKIDFDDQILFPVYYKLKVPTFDWVCVDEAQDLNTTQHALIKLMGGRLLAVGDPDQSIYAFRGANTESMPLLTRDFNATTLPLSVCYRCSSAVVDEAKTIVPRIEHYEGAKPGQVVEVSSRYWEPDKGELILCRTNAPLIKVCLRLLRQGMKAYILGRDFADSLHTMLKDIGEQGTPDDRKNRIQQYAKLKQNKKLQFQDCIEALMILADSTDMTKTIDRLFKETSDSIVLSTVHKAKGKEFENVSIIRPDLMPHPNATDLGQETNIKYVAITRAKNKLTYVKGDI